MKAKIQNGVSILNQVVNLVALSWMKMNKAQIPTTFAQIFHSLNDELVLHLVDKFSATKDFAQFYLNLDAKVTRLIFEYYSIPLEEDKYPTSLDRFTALSVQKKSRWEVFPFESQIVNQFYLMGNNNSLFYLKNISEDAFNHVQKRKVDPYGNGKNWSRAWSILTDREKEEVVEHLLNNKF